MQQYQDLVRLVLTEGTLKDQRAVLANGERPQMLSVFGHQMRFDLRAGFPLVTLKKTSFRHVATELLWYLSGSTNVGPLRDANVKIWDEWADPETGDLGPIYGKQWRRWEAPGGREIDQIDNLVRDIRELVVDPAASCGRRLVVSAWNPAEKPKKAPAACHSLFQFNVTKGRLSAHLYQRSADVFLGVPYNIACYSLLTHMLAQVTGLDVGSFIHSIGDAHIYSNHEAGARSMLERSPKPLPRLVLAPSIRELDDYRLEHMHIEGYTSHPPIPGDVAI